MIKIFSIITFIVLSVNVTAGENYKDMIISRAESGDVNSQKYLARAYLEGIGTYPKNVFESFKWISKAADQGDAEALFILYNYYALGIGCDKNFRLDLLIESANKHYPKALGEAGRLLSQLSGKEEEGHELLMKAYSSGVNSVLPLIAVHYMRKGDYSSGIAYFTKATEQCSGFDQAQAYRGLSFTYSQGYGVPKNLKKAHEFIDKAINIYPYEAGFYEDKGLLYLAEGNMSEATKMWNKTIDTSLTYAQESTSELAKAMNHSVDYGIPVTSTKQNNTYAIVIANENYKRVPNVPYAHNDGRVFCKYLVSSFGIPEENIEYLEDASLNDIKYALSNVSQRCNAFRDQLTIIVYYAGHGVSDEKTAEAFLLPVDGFGTDPSSGLNLDDFYSTLTEMPVKSIIVLLDACFSGAKRDGGMLMATRGITIKPKIQVPDGKLIVLSATSNDETAFPIEQQQHGLFTYTLLRKIQETGADITWGELTDYVTETVKNRSIDLNGKLQTPTVSVSSSMKDIWRNLRLR